MVGKRGPGLSRIAMHFARRTMDPLLTGDQFYTLRAAQNLIEQRRIHGNTIRPCCWRATARLCRKTSLE